jgi:hypothetical protein
MSICSRGFGMDSSVCPFVFWCSFWCINLPPRCAPKLQDLLREKILENIIWRFPVFYSSEQVSVLTVCLIFLGMSCAKIVSSWLDDWGITPTHQTVLGVSGWSSLLPYAHVKFSSPLHKTGGMFHVKLWLGGHCYKHPWVENFLVVSNSFL